MIESIASTQAALPGPASHDGATSVTDHAERQFAVLLSNTPAERADAQPAPETSEIVSTLTNRLDAISQGLRADPVTGPFDVGRSPLVAGDGTFASPPPTTAATDKVTAKDTVAAKDSGGPSTAFSAGIDKALDNYNRLVQFSVQANVVTMGSTTTTKSINKLMRGE